MLPHDELPRVRLTDVRVGPSGAALVEEVLRSGQLAPGPMVERFEAGFARMMDVAHAVAVTNGTVALVLALEALGIGPGDEVVTTPWTSAATLNAILARGASARLVDIQPEEFTLDVDAFAAALGPASRAVLPVHLYGLPADLRAVETIASVHDLHVVEDAAHAHCATVEGRPVGGAGVGAFSFSATKNMTTGEGGMVTTADSTVAERVRMLRNQGVREAWVHEALVHELPGGNARMSDVQAAIGVAELAEVALRTEQRRANAARLSEGLAELEGVVLPVEGPGRRHVFHQYVVRIRHEARLDRDTLQKELDAVGIDSAVAYPRPLHAYPCYRDDPRVVAGWLPEAERAGREVLSMPVHPGLSEGDLDRIVDTLRTLL